MSWRDPGQNGWFWGPFLVHWDSNLPSNVEKWTFWRPVRTDPAKVREKSCVWSVRSSRTPLDPPNFNLNYQKTRFYKKHRFSRFTNKCLELNVAFRPRPKCEIALNMFGWHRERNPNFAGYPWWVSMPDTGTRGRQLRRKCQLVNLGKTWGGFDKTEVCGKMVRNFMGPGLQFSVSPNSKIFICHDLR